MHEMAIARGILDIVLDYAGRQQARKVHRVGLLVGEMTGVEPEALDLCFQSLAKGTSADGAALKLKRTPLIGQCETCGRRGKIEQRSFFCPACGSARLETVSGRELQVEYLEVD